MSLLHHVTIMLERCSYVRCLMIDFSKAFDRVSHHILLSKLNKLDLPDRAINWIISYLIGCTQVVKCNGSISLPASINTSIVQGSGIGPMLYAIMDSDFHTLSAMNMLKNMQMTRTCLSLLTLTLTCLRNLIMSE